MKPRLFRWWRRSSEELHQEIEVCNFLQPHSKLAAQKIINDCHPLPLHLRALQELHKELLSIAQLASMPSLKETKRHKLALRAEELKRDIINLEARIDDLVAEEQNENASVLQSRCRSMLLQQQYSVWVQNHSITHAAAELQSRLKRSQAVQFLSVRQAATVLQKGVRRRLGMNTLRKVRFLNDAIKHAAFEVVCESSRVMQAAVRGKLCSLDYSESLDKVIKTEGAVVCQAFIRTFFHPKIDQYRFASHVLQTHAQRHVLCYGHRSRVVGATLLQACIRELKERGRLEISLQAPLPRNLPTPDTGLPRAYPAINQTTRQSLAAREGISQPKRKVVKYTRPPTRWETAMSSVLKSQATASLALGKADAPPQGIRATRSKAGWSTSLLSAMQPRQPREVSPSSPEPNELTTISLAERSINLSDFSSLDSFKVRNNNFIVSASEPEDPPKFFDSASGTTGNLSSEDAVTFQID